MILVCINNPDSPYLYYPSRGRFYSSFKNVLRAVGRFYDFFHIFGIGKNTQRTFQSIRKGFSETNRLEKSGLRFPNLQ